MPTQFESGFDPPTLIKMTLLSFQRVKRQSETAINTIVQMALKYAPLLINTFVGGGGSGGGVGGLADLAASFLGGGGAGVAAAKPPVNTKVTAVAPDKTDKIGGGLAVSVNVSILTLKLIFYCSSCFISKLSMVGEDVE